MINGEGHRQSRQQIPALTARGAKAGVKTQQQIERSKQDEYRFCERQQNKTGQQGRCRNELAQRSLSRMLAQYWNAPEAVVEILSKQAEQRGPRSVPGDDRWILPDETAREANSEVEFVVLISYQRFIEEADGYQRICAPAAVGNSVDRSTIIVVAKVGAAGGEWRMKSRVNCTRPVARGAGALWASRVRSPGRLQDRDTSGDVIGFVDSVGVHAHDEFTRGLKDSPVQASGDNSAGIIDDLTPGVKAGKFVENLPRAVAAHPIGDDGIEFEIRPVQRRKARKKFTNMRDLIAAGDDDRDAIGHS